MESLIRLIRNLKDSFYERGGFKSKSNIIKIILGIILYSCLIVLWALHTLHKNNGLLRKKSLRGEHIFLTGAGSGLGRYMSIQFAKMGAKLSISDVNMEWLEETSTNKLNNLM